MDRADLKVAYGEGFGGAPLQTTATPHPTRTGTREKGNEQAKDQGSKNVGGKDHV